MLAEDVGSVRAIEHAEEARRALLADLGHELGTPLHAITGSLELIDIRLCAPEDQVRLTQARESARRLDGVLQALLAVAGVDRWTPQVERRLPSSVLDVLIERWQRRAARRGQLLVGSLAGTDDHFDTDWPLLIASADAILDAATQYAIGGALNIELRCSADSVTLSIEDSGPELVPASPSYDSSADSPVRWAAMGRRGIGLAVAQQLANMTSATLLVTPGSIGGIRAEVTLPFA
jgi:two-component system, OmpR family, sensor histidine kinase PrrB